jgi:3-hydroxyacyl-[acyl-carrier-protein] dehydratase
VVALHRFERMPFLVAVKEAKLRTFVTPGQLLSIYAHLDHDGSGFAVVDARIKTEGKLICDATLTLRVLDFPNVEMEQQMRALAVRIGLKVGAPVDG